MGKLLHQLTPPPPAFACYPDHTSISVIVLSLGLGVILKLLSLKTSLETVFYLIFIYQSILHSNSYPAAMH